MDTSGKYDDIIHLSRPDSPHRARMSMVDLGAQFSPFAALVGYDIENLTDPKRLASYRAPLTTDHYGRKVPKHAHGTANLSRKTSSTRLITDAVMELYDRIVDENLLVRRINIVACNILPEGAVKAEQSYCQLDLFSEAVDREAEDAARAREKRRQQAVLTIRKKFGKNAILKGMNLEEGATAKDRNAQIGGHKA